jgi:hypothetical protein
LRYLDFNPKDACKRSHSSAVKIGVCFPSYVFPLQTNRLLNSS